MVSDNSKLARWRFLDVDGSWVSVFDRKLMCLDHEMF